MDRPLADSPERLELRRAYSFTAKFHVEFPWELNHTDYLRRVLVHLSLALTPAYDNTVMHYKVPPLMKVNHE